MRVFWRNTRIISILDIKVQKCASAVLHYAYSRRITPITIATE